MLITVRHRWMIHRCSKLTNKDFWECRQELRIVQHASLSIIKSLLFIYFFFRWTFYDNMTLTAVNLVKWNPTLMFLPLKLIFFLEPATQFSWQRVNAQWKTKSLPYFTNGKCHYTHTMTSHSRNKIRVQVGCISLSCPPAPHLFSLRIHTQEHTKQGECFLWELRGVNHNY